MQATRSVVAATILAALIAVGAWSTAATADDARERRSISVSGNGEAAGTPDLASINAGVQSMAATVNEAATSNQAAVARIMKALESAGIAKKDIRTVDYGIWPEQRYDPQRAEEPRITGYRVTNSVQVTVRDIGRVGDILAAVTNAGANSVNGITFGVADTAGLEARAREAAMKDARTKAEALAKLAGEQLGEVLQISLSSGGGYPMPMKMARMELADAAAAPPPGISTGEFSVSVEVQVTYAIR
jgi:uncharacterized protein